MNPILASSKVPRTASSYKPTVQHEPLEPELETLVETLYRQGKSRAEILDACLAYKC